MAHSIDISIETSEGANIVAVALAHLLSQSYKHNEGQDGDNGLKT